MKIKLGFVSNSSTSTTIVVVEEELFNDIVTKIGRGPELAQTIKKVWHKTNILGHSCMIFDVTVDNNGNSSLEGIDYSWDENDKLLDIIREYENIYPIKIWRY